ncbi:hypothetical protein PG994_015017 [Apiospora phragmitis]|uniref:2EXR domain-containing protein n=1 Tax=Apiospora phragmitis TaxID=2905665 RepID=A0ABR1SV96_9PEZI
MSSISPPATFFRFLNLPLEIRRMIWEETWSESRILELVHKETSTPTEFIEHLIIRPTCNLTKWLQLDVGSRSLDGEPMEACPNPVTLRVCHESRAYTLSRFVCMRHTALQSCAFYFNPQSDVLWLGLDLLSELDGGLSELQTWYHRQLESIRIILVEEAEWEEKSYAGSILDTFPGLREVKVLLMDNEFSDGFSETDEASMTSEDCLESAHRFQERDIDLLRGRDLVIGYIDRARNVYAHCRSEALTM